MSSTLNTRPSRRLWMIGTALACTAFGAAVGILGAGVVSAQSQPADVSQVAPESQAADPNLHHARHQREYVNWLIERHIAAQSGQSSD
ncbi:MAG TPA: hypothetical protein VFR23_12685 [Jiangellaceae bacterium]|nr:hypothetical protein [Jiangellaceae bacterium]